MNVKPVYFPYPNDLGYIKVFIAPEHLDFLEPLGQCYSNRQEMPEPEELPQEQVVFEIHPKADEQPIEIASTPDQGFGTTNSLQFHSNCIAEKETVEEVNKYLYSVIFEEVVPAGTLNAVKNRALRKLREHFGHD